MHLPIKRFLVAVTGLLIITSVTSAQSPPGDGNAWNPANWQVTVTKSGLDTGHGWKLENGTAVPDDSSQTWPASVLYPPLFDTAPRVWGRNQTDAYLGVSASSIGDTTLTFTWISSYPAPTHVVVRIDSSCLGEVSQDGTISMDNGIGSPVIWDLAHQSATCSGSQFRDLRVSGGVATVTVSNQASASASGFTSLAAVSAGNVSAAVAPKALSVTADFEPSYVIGYGDSSVPATFPDFANKEVWSAVTEYHADGSAEWSAFFLANMWGQWSPLNPLGAWLTFSWSYTDTPWQHYDYESFGADDIQMMITGGPRIVNIPLTVHDLGDGLSVSAQETVRIYAPRSFPTVTSDGLAYGLWLPASAIFDVNGNYETNKVQVTMSKAVVDTVTTGWSLTLGTELSAKFLDIFGAAIKPSGTFSWGETASISTTVTDSRWVSPIAGQVWSYWFERRKVWRQKTGTAFAYNRNGFEGLDDWQMNLFRSGTQAAAQAQDYEERFQAQRIS